jgi:hypothetical protein
MHLQINSREKMVVFLLNSTPTINRRRHCSLVLITGTSLNGLGFECARVIARYANLIILTGYNTERYAFFRFDLSGV